MGERKSLITTSSASNDTVWNKQNGFGRIVYSACLCGAIFLIGWTYEQTSVALLDLQYISQVSLTYASIYLTVVNIAQIFGSFLSSFLYGRVDTSILMVINSIGVAVAVTSVPWCYTFSFMLIAHFVHGMFGGSLDQVILAEMLALWESESGVPMQILSFVYACGATLSPLCTTPFLIDFNRSTSTQPHNRQIHMNIQDSVGLVTNNVTVTDSTANNHQMLGSSELYIPYSISGCLCLVVAVSFMFWFLLATLKNNEDLNFASKVSELNSSSLKTKFLIFVITGTLVGLDTGMEDSYSNFLTTFSVSYMGWTKLKGGFATSLFSASELVGQFIGIFLTICCKSTTLMISYGIVLCIANICFIFSGLYEFSTGIWLCCVFAGVGKAVVTPSLYALIQESFFPVTGRVATYFITSECIGSALNSLLIGYLMDTYSSMYLPYMLSLESFVYLILLLVCCIIEIYIRRGKQQLDNPICNK